MNTPIPGTGWRHKWLRGTGWRRKQPKKQSKQRSKCSCLHYQLKIPTKSIEELVIPKDHPRRNPSYWQTCHKGCAGNPRYFGRAPDGAPKGYCQGRGAQWRTHFPDSDGSKPDRKARLHATGCQHRRSVRQVESTKPKFHKYLWLSNEDWDIRYYQPKAVHHSAGS